MGLVVFQAVAVVAGLDLINKMKINKVNKKQIVVGMSGGVDSSMSLVLLKEEVYKLAKKEGFSFYLKRKQSQDFCFVVDKIFKNNTKDYE